MAMYWTASSCTSHSITFALRLILFEKVLTQFF